MSGSDSDLSKQFRDASTDASLVVLEGLHALKHAVRFGADVDCVVTADLATLNRLVDELAPDLAGFVAANAVEVPRDVFAGLTSRPPASPVLSIARTRRATAEEGAHASGVTVVLYEPRHAGNVGAAIRVAAAAGAVAVAVVGDLDPWSAAVVRASAGLHYALDVYRTQWPLALECPVVAFDAEGSSDARPRPDPATIAYVFGSERHGLPADVLAAASEVRRIPMRAGVSSLNLATSVAVALYTSFAGGSGLYPTLE